MFVEGENSVFFYSFFVFGFLAEREPEGEMGKRKREEEEGERREKKKNSFLFFSMHPSFVCVNSEYLLFPSFST